MPMRPFAIVRTSDQWLRCAFQDAALDRSAGVVGLAWSDPEPRAATSSVASVVGAGLAFDAGCRLYHSVPAEGRVERVLWALIDPSRSARAPLESVEVIAAGGRPVLGDVSSTTTPVPPLRAPRGLAVDDDEHLFIAESLARRVLVYDLTSRRLLRRLAVGPSRPVDLAARGSEVYALLDQPTRLLRFTARGVPHSVSLPPRADGATRLALSRDDEIVLLCAAGSAAARVVPLTRPDEGFDVPDATDVEFLDATTLVVARRPGDDFLRFELAPGTRTALLPLRARGYDGAGIARTPDGRIVYWTAQGPRHAVAARVVYGSRGRVITFRLDSGEYQTTWGDLFIDACIPEGTEVRVRCATADEVEPDARLLSRTPPTSVERAELSRPDLSPPMPPRALLGDDAYGSSAPSYPLHRRESGRELPWAQPRTGDPFATYEAPVIAPPGRYLWVMLELLGSSVRTPRVRCVRAEHPSHDYLRRLPRTFSRDEQVADFLGRYLAIFESFLGEIEGRAETRDALLDPRAAPDESLAWLASFVGLAVDERWPASTRRALIAEAMPLFRARGTLPGLARFLFLYLGVPVSIIEHYRLRGTGGALLGDTGPAYTSSVLGVGMRIGGAIGTAEDVPLSGTAAASYARTAHRFSVIIPAALTATQLDVVRHILDVHRPAHTIVEVCHVGAGMRVGRGLHVAISSIVGRSSGFVTLRLDGGMLGRGLLGRPTPGMTLGGSALGALPGVG